MLIIGILRLRKIIDQAEKKFNDAKGENAILKNIPPEKERRKINCGKRKSFRRRKLKRKEVRAEIELRHEARFVKPTIRNGQLIYIEKWAP